MSDGTGAALPCTISFSNGNQEVLIVLHAPLLPATVYDLTVMGVEDYAGNAVFPAHTQFTTGTTIDTTRSLTAVTVAAHEVGHAQQDAQARSWPRPIIVRTGPAVCLQWHRRPSTACCSTTGLAPTRDWTC